jgi:hypothetical protein
MAVYGSAFGVSVLSLRGTRVRSFAIPLGAVALVWSAGLATTLIGEQPLLDSEEAREMLGLLIVALWMAALASFPERPKEPEKEER